MDETLALGWTGFFQADGCVTFIGTSESGPQVNFTNWIQREHLGSAYAIIGYEYGGIRLLVAGLDDLFPVMCWPGTPACEASFPIVPIPMNDKSPVLAMEIGLDEPDHLYLASLESFWIFHLPTMRPLPGFFKWAGKPSVRAYAMDSVTIVQTRFDLKGIRILVILSGALPYHGRVPYSQPGLILSLFIAPKGVQVLPVTDTLMDTSPLSFHQPSIYPGVYFWTQINNNSSVAYINSHGGAQEEPNTHILLKTGFSLAPGFAEVTNRNAGLVSIGRYNNSQALFGLRLAYDPISGPGISVTSTDPSASTVGRPLLFCQPNRKLPFIIALVRTMNATYAIEVYNFNDLYPTPASLPPHSISRAPYFANTQDNIDSRTLGDTASTRKRMPKTDPLSLSPHKVNHVEDALPPNCVTSGCSFEEDGDCPPDHCWVFGATAQFYCCLKPPV